MTTNEQAYNFLLFREAYHEASPTAHTILQEIFTSTHTYLLNIPKGEGKKGLLDYLLVFSPFTEVDYLEENVEQELRDLLTILKLQDFLTIETKERVRVTLNLKSFLMDLTVLVMLGDPLDAKLYRKEKEGK